MIYLIPDTQEGLDLANTLRNQQITQGKGALLIRPDCDGDPVHLLEKIIDGDRFIPGEKTVDQIKWKKESIVILVGIGRDLLADLDYKCPGFSTYFGPYRDFGVL